MKSFTDIIQRQFPYDDRLGFYVKPNIPAPKLGRVLNDFTRISPGDVVACHVFGGVFASSSIALTDTACYYEKAYFNLEDVKGAKAEDKHVTVDVNQGGQTGHHTLKAENAEAATLLAKVIDNIAYEPKADDLVPADYSKYSASNLNWLEMRDEVMRTIDLLYNRFQDGKIGLTEFEEKKADLLSRL